MKLNWITKFVPILIVGGSAIGLAQAQTTPTTPTPTTQVKATKPGHGRKGINSILAQLNLSKDQRKQVKTLEKTRRQDAKAYKEANPGADIVDKSGHKAHNQKAMETFMTGLKGILTPTQWDQFQTQFKAAHVKQKPKKGTPPVAPTNI